MPNSNGASSSGGKAFERSRWTSVMLLLVAMTLGAVGSAPALADTAIIQRHVTLREAPSSQSRALDYPAIGERLILLDSGARRSGYYHVRQTDGTVGWVYQSFVRVEPDAAAATGAAAAGSQMSVHYVDVDQGAAELVEFPCAAILIDAGGRGQAASDHLIAYLEAFFARRPDLNRTFAAVFITHTHVDHNSNLERVAQSFGIARYIHNGRLEGSGRAAANWMLGHAAQAHPPVTVEAVDDTSFSASTSSALTDATIDPVSCPGVDPQIRVLAGGHPSNAGWSATDYGNGNNHSLTIRIDYGKSSFLFTGDSETAEIQRLLTRYGPTGLLDADVYQVGHHGAENGTTFELLKAVSPRVAIISMGRPETHEQWTAWAYGHPRRKLVTLLEPNVTDTRPPVDVSVADGQYHFSPYHLTRAIYATGWDGDVTVTADAAGQIRVDPGR